MGLKHELFVAFIDLFRWIDRRSRKRPHQVISRLDRLVDDPVTTLTESPVIIPPYVPRGTIIFWVMSVTFFVSGLSCCGALDIGQNSPYRRHMLVAMLVLCLVVLPTILWIVLTRLLRGSTMVLDVQGVRLIDRRVEVFCPWSAFSIPCRIRREKGSAPTVLVEGSAIPSITASRRGKVFAVGEDITTRQLAVVSVEEVEIPSRYKVHIEELLELLFTLGARIRLTQ